MLTFVPATFLSFKLNLHDFSSVGFSSSFSRRTNTHPAKPNLNLACPLRFSDQTLFLLFGLRMSGLEEPKSSYYKRPSKAFEKGGGFYIPGLRGPRLRVATSVLVLVLATLNHSYQKVPPLQVTISELAALSAAAILYLTTVIESVAAQQGQEKEELEQQQQQPRRRQQQQLKTEVSVQQMKGRGLEVETSMSKAVQVRKKFLDQASWSAQAVLGITKANYFAIFQNDAMIFRDGITPSGAQNLGGPVIDRVASENRGAIFISDCSTLPPDVKIPFYGSQRDGSAAYVIPVSPKKADLGERSSGNNKADYVVVVGRVGNTSNNKTDDDWLPSRNRAWIVEIAQGLLVHDSAV